MAPSRAVAPNCDDILDRRNNPLDLRRQARERSPLFLVVFMPIIRAPDAADNMAQAAFGNIGRDAGPGHQTPRRSAKIVNGVVVDPADPIKADLEFREAADWRFAIGAKHPLAIGNW